MSAGSVRRPISGTDGGHQRRAWLANHHAVTVPKKKPRDAGLFVWLLQLGAQAPKRRRALQLLLLHEVVEVGFRELKPQVGVFAVGRVVVENLLPARVLG